MLGVHPERVALYVHLAPVFENRLDLKKFGSWLNETLGLKSGGSKNQLQGGGAKFNANDSATIKSWIEQHLA